MKKRSIRESFSKIPLFYFVLVSAVCSAAIVFFTLRFNLRSSNMVLFLIIEFVNFFIFGYSFRIKKEKPGKFVSAGALLVLAGFAVLYVLGLLESSPTTISIATPASAMILEPYSTLAISLSIASTLILLAGYLCLLMGFKEVISK